MNNFFYSKISIPHIYRQIKPSHSPKQNCYKSNQFFFIKENMYNPFKYLANNTLINFLIKYYKTSIQNSVCAPYWKFNSLPLTFPNINFTMSVKLLHQMSKISQENRGKRSRNIPKTEKMQLILNTINSFEVQLNEWLQWVSE